MARAASAGSSAASRAPISSSLTWPLRPSRTDEKRVADLERKRPFEIDLHVGVRAERAGDDVLGDEAGHLAARHLSGGLHFPHQAVIEGKLFELAAAQAIDAAVAHVGDERRARQQHEHAAGGAHALELGVGLAAFVNRGIGGLDGAAHGLGGSAVGELAIRVGNALAGHLAGQLAGGMCAHAVGHHEQVAAAIPIDVVAGQVHGERVLVVGAPQADVAQRGVHQRGMRASREYGRFAHVRFQLRQATARRPKTTGDKVSRARFSTKKSAEARPTALGRRCSPNTPVACNSLLPACNCPACLLAPRAHSNLAVICGIESGLIQARQFAALQGACGRPASGLRMATAAAQEGGLAAARRGPYTPQPGRSAVAGGSHHVPVLGSISAVAILSTLCDRLRSHLRRSLVWLLVAIGCAARPAACSGG